MTISSTQGPATRTLATQSLDGHDPAPGAGSAGQGRLVAVIGASGKSGAAIVRALAARGVACRAVVRDAARWAAIGLPFAPAIADLNDPAALRAALAGATEVVSTAHARWAAAVLHAAPQARCCVFLGSTRRYSRWHDDHGDGVRAGEAAFLAAGRPGVMLHPTMIYGREGEGDVQRLVHLLRRIPLAPLPGGGNALVQPIYQDDLTRCVLAALERSWEGPTVLVTPGPAPIAYRDFLAMVARAAGLRVPPILSVPVAPLLMLASLTRLLPGLPAVSTAAVRRLTEDKAFDPGPMRDQLGVAPIPLAEGLRLTFAA